jgi:medium-chain acyl-[acyl-carrier-protein] hydrolase
LHLFVSGQTAPLLPDPKAPVSGLPDHEFVSEVRRRYDRLPAEILGNDEMLRLILPSLRADFAIKETYQYIEGPLLECPISCIGGRDDHTISVEGLTAWRAQAKGVFKLRMFPGAHFFIDTARASVLELIAKELECSLSKEIYKRIDKGGKCDHA